MIHILNEINIYLIQDSNSTQVALQQDEGEVLEWRDPIFVGEHPDIGQFPNDLIVVEAGKRCSGNVLRVKPSDEHMEGSRGDIVQDTVMCVVHELDEVGRMAEDESQLDAESGA